jgi:hypothetical protein
MQKRFCVRWMCAVLLAAVIAIAPRTGAMQSPQVALAANTCQGAIMQFDGWTDSANQGWGTSANITTRVPAFCTTTDASNDFIYAWSMIEDTNGNNYAQIGYRINHGSGTTYIWSEYKYSSCGGGFCDSTGPATSNGQNYQYYEDFDTYIYYDIDMGYGGTLLDATAYDPSCTCVGANYWPGPWKHQFFGENYNAGDDVPGLSTSHATFSSLGWEQNPNSSGARPPTFSLITSHSTPPDYSQNYYCTQQNSASSFDMWTASSCVHQ